MLALPSDQRNRKPDLRARLNRAHPLAHGLVGAWLFTEGSSRDGVNGTRNLAGSTDPLVQDGASTWTVTSAGLAVRSNGWHGFSNYAPSVAVRPAYLKTILWYGVLLGPPGDPTNAPPLFTHYTNTSSTAPFNSGSIHRYNDDSTVLFAWNNGSFGSQQVTAILPSFGIPVQIALTLDGTEARMFVAGEWVSTSTSNIPTAGSPIQYDATSYQTFGVHPSSGSINSNAAALMILEWNRALSVEEVASVNASPYAMFRSRDYFIIAAAGGGPVTGTASSQTGSRATDAGTKQASSAIAAETGARGTASGVKTVAAPVVARSGARATAAGNAAGAATGTAAGRSGTRATAAGREQASGAVVGRTGLEATVAGREQASSAVAARAAARATATGVQISGASGSASSEAGARATVAGRAQPGGAATARAGLTGTASGAKTVTGAAQSRGGPQATTSGTTTAQPHILVGSTGARATCAGRHNALAAIAGTVGSRATHSGARRALGTSTSSVGAEALVLGLHGGRSTAIVGRTAARARAAGGQGEQPVGTPRRVLIVPPRPLVGAVSGGREALRVVEV